MKVSVVVIVIMILCFIAGFCFGFRIKQRVYEVLLKNWERIMEKHLNSNHELLKETIYGFDGLFNKHKELLLIAKRNSHNICDGCEHINDDSGYCYDCYNCSKKYVKGGGDG
ncbi:MAG: hypothetical protein IKV81_03740 [Clostridia bacterium]|nr:hypothetical protein [Clostridia bacterium]